jgi:hypothetical protein
MVTAGVLLPPASPQRFAKIPAVHPIFAHNRVRIFVDVAALRARVQSVEGRTGHTLYKAVVGPNRPGAAGQWGNPTWHFSGLGGSLAQGYYVASSITG